MAIDRSVIRVKAMIVLPSADGAAHLVSVNQPSAENPEGFHRLIGGSVELGERHEDAIVREVHEELGATIVDLRLLDVVQNIFSFNGELGHEIVFVYTGSLEPAVPPEGGFLIESDGARVPVMWRPVADEGQVPLYPAGVPLDQCFAPPHGRR